MVMFKLKRCVAPSRDDYDKLKEKMTDVQKVPLMLEDINSKEKVQMLADEIVVCV